MGEGARAAHAGMGVKARKAGRACGTFTRAMPSFSTVQNPQPSEPGSNGATTGYERELWRMADALRGSMDAAEYKHVVLGLIFLKYISDAFEETRAQLETEEWAGLGGPRRVPRPGCLLGAAGSALA